MSTLVTVSVEGFDRTMKVPWKNFQVVITRPPTIPQS